MDKNELKSYFPVTRLSIFCGFPFWLLGMIWQFIIYQPFVQGSAWVYRHFWWETMNYNEALKKEGRNNSQFVGEEDDDNLFDDIDDNDDNNDEEHW